MRLFSKWCAEEIEKVCSRNDHKPAWENQNILTILDKIHEEYLEVLDAVGSCEYWGNEDAEKHIVWECADLAATAMMLASKFDNKTKNLRRGNL